jgi:CRP-like cAMP-binding protein
VCRQQERFLSAFEPCEFSAGQHIVRQDDMGDRFFIIVSGEVIVFDEKKQMKLCSLYAGSHFGEFRYALSCVR